MKKTYRRAASLMLAAAVLLTPQAAFADKKEGKESWTDKILRYEAISPAYEYDKNADTPHAVRKSSRFIEENGIYRNPDAKAAGEATLMITGDLMCQYRQQQAAFTSNGSSYPTYEDMQTVISAEKSEYNQAHKDALKNESPEFIPEEGSALSSFAVPELNYGEVPQPEGEWDFDESFQYVRKILRRGDLVIGNLETMISHSSPLTMQVRRLEDKPYLNSPSEFLEAVKYAGYDVLTLANNHNCDTGVQGLLETLENLDRYRFMHTGMFADSESSRYLIVDVNGIKVGIVSYATYFNTKEDNFSLEGQEVLLNEFDKDTARRDIRNAKKAGAEFVIAFMHWGRENTHDTTSKQERFAREAARAGADYIVGSHPHALQPYDIIETSDGREVPVIYSMGNFLSCMLNDVNNDTMVLQLNLKKNQDGTVSVKSHRAYSCTILPEHTAASDDGSTQTDSYVIVPHSEAYGPGLNRDKLLSASELDYMEDSLQRIMDVYDNQLIFDVPYDPYNLNADLTSNDDRMEIKDAALGRILWLAANRPV